MTGGATNDSIHYHKMRRDWGIFRDRRPELYRGLTTHDGRE
ncbi:MAG: hypothetical protein ACRES7_08075 [Gammaproteobacteria bacterium]